MNLKLSFGIFVPLALVFVLIVLSTADIGYSVSKETVDSLRYSDLFVERHDSMKYVNPMESVPVQTIAVVNDFFLPKKYELPRLSACAVEGDGLKPPMQLNVRYMEGTYSTNDKQGFDMYDRFGSRQGVDIPAYSEKQVRILVTKTVVNQGFDSKSPNAKYDSLLLIESDGYTSCYNLESKDMESAIRIPLV